MFLKYFYLQMQDTRLYKLRFALGVILPNGREFSLRQPGKCWEEHPSRVTNTFITSYSIISYICKKVYIWNIKKNVKSVWGAYKYWNHRFPRRVKIKEQMLSIIYFLCLFWSLSVADNGYKKIKTFSFVKKIIIS